MARLACVNVIALPLQLLAREHPEWRNLPVALVAEEKPGARVLAVNRRARACGVRTGMRYAEAMSLARSLRAGAVPQQAIRECVGSLVKLLRRASPNVEPSHSEPGVFWLDGAGLARLFPTAHAWGAAIREAVEGAGWRASVAVGCTRLGAHVLAKGDRGLRIAEHPDEEGRHVRRVRIERLGIAPETRDALEELHVRTVGDLLRLPSAGILRRFGPELHRFHEEARNIFSTPLNPEPEKLPLRERCVLDEPETDAIRLFFLLKPLVTALAVAASRRSEAIQVLHVSLKLDGGTAEEHALRPALPTTSDALLADLLRLRLEQVPLSAGVVEAELRATVLRIRCEQLSLLEAPPKRDLLGGARALARLRAEFGDRVVVRARLRDGHLPEARFTLEPIDHVPLPKPQPGVSMTLVRRINHTPQPLPTWPRNPEHWRPNQDALADRIVRFIGPDRVTGGWWAKEQHRDYYFAELQGGGILWVYHDRIRGRWFLHGRVE